MNPLTQTKNLQKLNQKELSLGLTGGTGSWHKGYDDSAWIFVGGLPYDLTEGDIITVFSQYGEIVNINLVRDRVTGKQKGFCFICYEDQRSTILAVDNLNNLKILNRTLRVDHAANYRKPEEKEDEDELTRKLRLEGCGPQIRIEKLSKKLRKEENKKKNDDEGRTRDGEVKKNESEGSLEEDRKPRVKVENDGSHELDRNRPGGDNDDGRHVGHRKDRRGDDRHGDDDDDDDRRRDNNHKKIRDDDDDKRHNDNHKRREADYESDRRHNSHQKKRRNDDDDEESRDEYDDAKRSRKSRR